MKTSLPTVDMRSKQSILDYLSGHFRYDTMSSNNLSTSFAHNVKIRNLGLSRDPRIAEFDAKHGAGAADDAAYELLNIDDLWNRFASEPIREFTNKMQGRYTIAANGRSGGYLVLYSSSLVESPHKSYCQSCGQRNFQKVDTASSDPKANKCGRCGATGDDGRVNYPESRKVLEIHAGRSVGTDLEEFEMYELKDLAKVVLEFDKACLKIRDNFIKLIVKYKVAQKQIKVPKTVNVLQAR